jgi:hypothetical protein
MKGILAAPDPNCPMINVRGIHSSQGLNRRGQKMSRSFVSRNRGHFNLDIEPIRAPVFSEVRLAAGCNLDSCNSSSRVLSTGVESTTRVVSFVELTVVDLNDVEHDDQLEESCESINTKVAAEGFHDPNELGNFQERGQ